MTISAIETGFWSDLPKITAECGLSKEKERKSREKEMCFVY